jgi:hypothetical protein
MAEKTYTLTITYDEETEEVVEYQEYIDADDRWFSVGDIDLTDYWDKEAISWIDEMYDIGEA